MESKTFAFPSPPCSNALSNGVAKSKSQSLVMSSSWHPSNKKAESSSPSLVMSSAWCPSTRKLRAFHQVPSWARPNAHLFTYNLHLDTWGKWEVLQVKFCTLNKSNFQKPNRANSFFFFFFFLLGLSLS